MALCAELTAPAVGNPHARVAGLTVLLRQLLSLQDAGITEVVAAVHVAELPRDPRLTMKLRSSLTRGGASPAVRAIITAPLGLVSHRALPARLLRAGYSGSLMSAPLAPGEFIVPAVDAAACRDAEALLLASLVKPTDGLVSRAINRRLSLRITRLLIDTAWTPNQVTLAAGVVGALGCLGVACGGVGWLLPGVLLVNAQSILDGCDGELARLKYMRSRLGEWLDQVLDDAVNTVFFATAGWSLYRAGLHFMGTFTLTCVAFQVLYLTALYTAVAMRGGGSGSVTSVQWWGQRDHAVPRGADGRRRVLVWLADAVETGTRRDLFTFLYLPAVALGHMEMALLWTGFVFCTSAVYLLLGWVVRGGPVSATRTS